ncbi:hypothetical protein [Treponema sp.]|uniref:hypothetical protein n=1 Tax=Treponema sp. TaxID=166 RepID=UPI0025F79541|nr:hypothetical protein [Treponema sp.]MCR5218384.1 hypothetical protein [Treponema sp.]
MKKLTLLFISSLFAFFPFSLCGYVYSQDLTSPADNGPSSVSPAIIPETVEKEELLSLMNKTHGEVIELLGAPDYIRKSTGQTLFFIQGTTVYSDDYVKDCVEFVYKDKKINVLFDDQGRFLRLFNKYYYNREASIVGSEGTLRATGVTFYSGCSDDYELPYGLSFDDKLADVFEKLGNPLKYTPQLVTYEFAVDDVKGSQRPQDVKIATENYPYFTVNKIYDTLEIGFEENKIVSLKVTRYRSYNMHSEN